MAGLTDTVVDKLPQLEAAFGGLPAALQALFTIGADGNFLKIDATCIQTAHAPCVNGSYSVP